MSNSFLMSSPEKTITKRSTRSQSKQNLQERTLPEPVIELPDPPLEPIQPYRQPDGTASWVAGDNYRPWSVTMYQRWQDPVG